MGEVISIKKGSTGKREIITGKDITICISGNNEQEIDAALDEAFKDVLRRVKRGQFSMDKWKNIDTSIKFRFETAEHAIHV